jgi:peptidoglycan/xylan/chitin deacetylase (PgdA/CDA1 family)
MGKNNGILVVSLDYELMWGAIFNESVRNGYEERVPLVKAIIPRLLDLFSKYGIHATWAVVGAIGCNNKLEAQQLACTKITDPYSGETLVDVINRTTDDECYYSPPSISRIANTKGQFVGSHTFSHFYVYEHDSSSEKLKAEIRNSMLVLDHFFHPLRTVIFPKNQINEEALATMKDTGLNIYRGKQQSDRFNSNTRFSRLMRFIDAYLPVCGENSYYLSDVYNNGMFNVRASRFLRTYFKRLRFLEELKIRRVLREMTTAAEKGKVYHLWWHPHNFATNVEFNMRQLEKIFLHYSRLKEKYGFASYSMEECACLAHDCGNKN